MPEGFDVATFIETSSKHAIRKHVRRRLAEMDMKDVGLSEVSVIVKDAVKDRFDRCREIASRRERKSLDDGQVFERLVDHYLDSFDPERVKPGERRVPGTSARPDDRYVPAEVEREVRRIAQDRCEVPGCTYTTFVVLCHAIAHVRGGNREVGNLWLGSTRHHTMHDAGQFRMTGRAADGRAIFVTKDGEEIRPNGSPGVVHDGDPP